MDSNEIKSILEIYILNPFHSDHWLYTFKIHKGFIKASGILGKLGFDRLYLNKNFSYGYQMNTAGTLEVLAEKIKKYYLIDQQRYFTDLKIGELHLYELDLEDNISYLTTNIKRLEFLLKQNDSNVKIAGLFRKVVFNLEEFFL